MGYRRAICAPILACDNRKHIMHDMNTPPDLRQYFTSLLSPVCELMHDHLQEAAETAREHLHPFGMAQGYAFTNLTRAHLDRLMGDDELPGFRLREPRPNGRIQLAAPDGSSLRVLHALPGGAVPPPGRNRARIMYWQQGLRLPIGDDRVSDLLALWYIDQAQQPCWRIVRPIGRWQFGRKEKVDLDFWLPQTAGGLDELVFEPDDTGLLLLIDEDQETAALEDVDIDGANSRDTDPL